MSANPESGGGKKRSMLPIIIGVVALVVVLFVGKGVLGGSAAESKKKAGKTAAELGTTLQLDEFLVNLKGSGDHYLRTTIALGMRKGMKEEEIKEHVPAMRDAILMILSSKTLKDLADPTARDDLKEEMVTRINEEADEENVVKVFFTAFTTQ